MKTFILAGFFLFAFAMQIYSQETESSLISPNGFTEITGSDFDTNEKCISDEDHKRAEIQTATTIKRFREEGLFDRYFNKRSQAVPPLLEWPMRQADGFNDPGYYAISNYVDLDPTGGVLDYNGLNQTYDTHNGIDIRTDPYFWKKKQDNHVEAIAAADGILTVNQDGNFDNNCTCTGTWNVVTLTHADGSVTWYGHLKTGTLTTRDIGDFIEVGEYLGVIGSSGCSTNPHLHLEVYDNLGNRIEPFAGPSNSTTNTSWWANQLPYYDAAVNKIATHSTAPTFPACPGVEVPNEKDVFDQGDPITFSVAIRHSLTSDSAKLEVFEPDGDQSNILDLTYIRNGTFFLRTALPSWNRTIANNAQQGLWRFKVTYYTDTYGVQVEQKNFFVTQDCSPNIVHNNPLTVSRYYQASNTITSSSTMSNNIIIGYDAENVVTLSPGFRAPVGSKLEVKTAGCN